MSQRSSAPPRAVILYDADCGFCRWSLAKALAWDRKRLLRPVALQDPETDRLLAGMSEEKRMASWHLVSQDGAVHSAGTAFAPLLRLLPAGRRVAPLVAKFPRATDAGYWMVAKRRVWLGKLVRRLGGEGALERADRRIAGATSASTHGP